LDVCKKMNARHFKQIGASVKYALLYLSLATLCDSLDRRQYVALLRLFRLIGLGAFVVVSQVGCGVEFTATGML
jgi:hypothetical protein